MKSMDKLTTGVAYGTSAGSAGYWFLQLLDKVTPSQWAAIGVLGSLVKQVRMQPESMQARQQSRINMSYSHCLMCGYRLTIHWICLLAFRLVISK